MKDSTASKLTVLGIETSCDETAAAVVRVADGRVQVLSSVVASQIDDHAPFGGVVPEIAARAHVQAIDGVIAKAMADAGVDFAGLDGVAATAGPGLVGGVMVGLSAGKAIALARDLPLIAVNHLEGHALSVRLTEAVDYPFLLLLVSGGHCQLLTWRAWAPAAGWARPSTTRPARPSTRSPSPSACPIRAARRWSGWPSTAIRTGSPCRAPFWAARTATSPSRA